jgi:RNA polymerase sigma-32 factor
MYSTSDSTLARYMTMVQAFPRISREEESNLCRKWRHDGDDRARDALVRANLRYAVVIALKYRRYGLPLAELIAEGNFGIVQALAKFEPDRGHRFITYAAYWIRAYVLNHIVHCWSLVGSGSGPLRSKMFFKLRRERARIYNLVGDGDRADELLAQRLGVPHAQIVAATRQCDARDLSLDLNLFGDAPGNLVDMLESQDSNQEQAYELIQDRGYRRSVVRTALNVLDKREKMVVEWRLMQDPEEEMSLASIGRRLGISRERARQIEVRAKRKLRQRILELTASQSIEGVQVESAA